MNLSYLCSRILIIFVVAALVTPSVALAGDKPAEIGDSTSHAAAGHASDHLLVGVQIGLTRDEVAVQLAAAGMTLLRYWPRQAIAEATLTHTSTASSADLANPDSIMARSSGVNQTFRYITQNQRVYAADSNLSQLEPPKREPQPNDALFGEQWAPDIIRLVDAWNITYGDPNVVIGIIDSGYDTGHPDLDPARIWTNQVEADGIPGIDDDGNGLIDDFHGWDWVESDNVPNDPYGHGTHVLGTIAATTGNKTGIAGIGRNLKVAPLRMLGPDGSGFVSDLIDALNYAVDKDMDIVNLSLTIGFDNSAVRDAVSSASQAGLLIVAATGNYSSHVLWPAAYPDTVAVAATNSQDQRSSFSNFGPEVDIAAPGSDIISLYTGSTYQILDGTSMATPHVSALLGLLRSLRPDLNNQQLLDIAKGAADDVNAATHPGVDDFLGSGRMNVYQSLLQASRDLTLQPTPRSLTPLPFGEQFALQVKVSTPQANGAQDANAAIADSAPPVAGAVVYAQILKSGNSADSAAISTRRKITNQNGVAKFTLTTPGQVGDYVVRIQVGSAYIDMPLEVIEPPGTIGLYVLSPNMTAGDDSTEYRIKLRDNEGQLLTGETPLTVETSIGTLDGGAVKLNVIAQDGVYTGTLYGGSLAGKGTLTVSVGTRESTAVIRVLPDVPAQVVITTRPDDTRIEDVATYFSFDVSVHDQYGNAVKNGTPVRLSSSAGDLKPFLGATEGGVAVINLMVPRSHHDPVNVYAEIPDYDGVSATIQVQVIAPALWLPFIWSH